MQNIQRVTQTTIGVLAFLVFQISPPTFAATVNVGWNANSESDLAGYSVHYGTASGSYTYHINVGNKTSQLITNLSTGATYYFAVTAYDAAGNESLPSTEASIAIPEATGASQTDTGQTAEAPDTDMDGLPDPYEISMGLDANDPRDSLADADGDGVVNLVEYMANTDIHDSLSHPAQDETLKDIIGEVGAISLSEIDPSSRYRFIPLLDGDPSPVNNILSIIVPGVYLYNVIDSEDGLVYRLRVSLTKRLLAVGAYDQTTKLELHDNELGITVDIPAGALIRDIEIGIGNTTATADAALSDPRNSLDFEILPYGLILTKPAQVTVPYTGKDPVVQRFDETSQQWVRVENVQAASGLVTFATQTVGRFQIYAAAADQTTDSGSPTDDSGGGGGGGGGCFIATAGTF